MKKKLLLTLVILLPVFALAKTYDDVATKYYRSSIYSILVNHNEQKFANEIRSQFLNIPIPDQYNDHDLNIKVITVNKKGNYLDSINQFIDRNHIASRMVAKWFNRDIFDGTCNIDLVSSRSVYNASELEKELASRSARGMSMLADMGDELIGHTFLLVNEIRYQDKGKVSGGIGIGLKILGAVAAVATGSSDFMDMGNSLGDLTASLKGFKVKIITHLYQLVWDEEAATTFYTSHYTDKPDVEKYNAFERDRSMFKLKYLGNVESSGSTTSFLGINEDEPLLMVRKACQRAIDENVADLQKHYDQFRVKAPILETNGNEVKVAIGLKEGITESSKFEVLEAQEKDGRTVYKRVAVIQPVKAHIWDNRFMAKEEGAYGAEFGATTFKKVSGGDIIEGYLVRQM